MPKRILEISAMQQKMEHISSVQMAEHFGMKESLEDMIIARRLFAWACS